MKKMKNITVSIPETAYLRARVWAAEVCARRIPKFRCQEKEPERAISEPLLHAMVDAVGIEPTTCRLRAECSAS